MSGCLWNRDRSSSVTHTWPSTACFLAGIVAMFGFVPFAARAQTTTREASIGSAQTPNWSADDMAFFLHGSMGTEVMPENVVAAFRATYPDLLPGRDLTAFGLIADPAAGLPIGISRRDVPHLGGLRSFGINCASCHVTEVALTKDGAPVRVLGVGGNFDVEALFGAVTVATFRTADAANTIGKWGSAGIGSGARRPPHLPRGRSSTRWNQEATRR